MKAIETSSLYTVGYDGPQGEVQISPNIELFALANKIIFYAFQNYDESMGVSIDVMASAVSGKADLNQAIALLIDAGLMWHEDSDRHAGRLHFGRALMFDWINAPPEGGAK